MLPKPGPEWRSRRLARTLCALAAAGGCAALLAQPRSDDRVEMRSAVTDPARAGAGEFFRLHERALAWQLPGEVAAALAGNEALLATWSADRLAREYLVAADGAASDAITVGALRAAGGAAGPEQALLSAARNTVTMPDGHAIALPVARSHGMHLWLMQASAKARTAAGGAPQMAGQRRLTVQGDCPLAAGPLTLVQQGFVVEGRRDGRLLLQGAAGSEQIWWTAVETRYLRSVRAGDRLVELRVPDRPSGLYRTALAPGTLVLQGADGAPDCQMALEAMP